MYFHSCGVLKSFYTVVFLLKEKKSKFFVHFRKAGLQDDASTRVPVGIPFPAGLRFIICRINVFVSLKILFLCD